MPLGAGHRSVTVCGCAVICFTVFLVLITFAAFYRCYQGTVLAIWTVRRPGEHAMEACQIGSRSGYQGCQARDKVQWLEDNVGSAIPTAFANAHGASFLDKVFSAGSEHYHPMLTTSAFPKRPGSCRRNCP